MRYRIIVSSLAIAAMSPLLACSEKQANEAATNAEADSSLIKVIKSDPDLSVFAKALDAADLAGVFDEGSGEYTVLAPDDSAFGKLSDAAEALMQPEQKAVLVAVLREQILPGAIMPDDIKKALDEANGKPVSMTTLGSGVVEFTNENGKIVITNAEGQKIHFSGKPIKAKNGVVISVDRLFKLADSGA